MARAVQFIRPYTVRGKYNRVKLQVLVALYCAQFWYKLPGLTFSQLASLSHASKDYLRNRLPVFAGSKNYQLTKELWQHPIIKRHMVSIAGSSSRYRYALNANGRRTCEQRVERSLFVAVVKELRLNDRTYVLKVLNGQPQPLNAVRAKVVSLGG